MLHFSPFYTARSNYDHISGLHYCSSAISCARGGDCMNHDRPTDLELHHAQLMVPRVFIRTIGWLQEPIGDKRQVGVDFLSECDFTASSLRPSLLRLG